MKKVSIQTGYFNYIFVDLVYDMEAWLNQNEVKQFTKPKWKLHILDQLWYIVESLF